jgi:hypothetical protein
MVFSENWELETSFRKRDVWMVYKLGCYHCCPRNCKVTSRYIFLHMNIQSQSTKVKECKNVFGSLDVHTKQIEWTTWEGQDYNDADLGSYAIVKTLMHDIGGWREINFFAVIQGWLPHGHKVCEVVEEKYQWVEACSWTSLGTCLESMSIFMFKARLEYVTLLSKWDELNLMVLSSIKSLEGVPKWHSIM